VTLLERDEFVAGRPEDAPVWTGKGILPGPAFDDMVAATAGVRSADR
jgi:hypothetical protein